MKESVIQDAITSLVPSDWESKHGNIAYKLYDFSEPHCDLAKPYRDVYRNIRYRCRHDEEVTDGN